MQIRGEMFLKSWLKVYNKAGVAGNFNLLPPREQRWNSFLNRHGPVQCSLALPSLATVESPAWVVVELHS